MYKTQNKWFVRQIIYMVYLSKNIKSWIGKILGAFLLFMFFGNGAWADITSGLVAHYEFEGNANDSSGNGNHGTEYGGLTYADGVSGKAGKFASGLNTIIGDTSGSYIEVNNNSSLQITDSITISSWVKISNSDYNVYGNEWNSLLTKSSFGTSYGVMIARDSQDNTTLRFYHKGLTTDSTDMSWNDFQINKWYFLTLTYDGIKTQIYLDGILKTSSITNGKIEKNSQNIIFGLNKYTQDAWYPYYLQGFLDDLRIYNRALSESEINELYNLKSNTATSRYVFHDSFDSETLDSSKWTAQNTNNASFALSNGSLIATAQGGSDGYMGIGDGYGFTSSISNLPQDYEIVLSGKEIERVKNGSYKDNSGFSLNLSDSSGSTISIGIGGNYSGYHPDPAYSGWSYYDQYQGHRIAIYANKNNSTVDFKKYELDLNTLYNVDFKIAFKNSKYTLSYRLSSTSEWIDYTLENYFFDSIANLKPAFGIWSGDGGTTRQNGKFVGEITDFYVKDLTGLISSMPASFTDNQSFITFMQNADKNITSLNLSSTLSSPLSRAEAVYLLDSVLVSSVPAWKVDVWGYPITFGDVDENAIYGDSVKRLSYYKGSDNETVITKANELFNPLRSTSRQEFVKMVLQGFNLAYSGSTQSLEAFSDRADIADWAVKYFQYAVEKEIIVGNNGNLLPNENITREEALNILRRTINALNGSYLHNESGYETDIFDGLRKEIDDEGQFVGFNGDATPIQITDIKQSAVSQNRKTLIATSTADTANGAIRNCKWKSNFGYFSINDSYNGNASVYFYPSLIKPTSDYEVIATCSDGLGYEDEQSITIDPNLFTYPQNEIQSEVVNGASIFEGLSPSQIVANSIIDFRVNQANMKDGMNLGQSEMVMYLTDGTTKVKVFEGRTYDGYVSIEVPYISSFVNKSVYLEATVLSYKSQSKIQSNSMVYYPEFTIRGKVVADEDLNISSVVINGTTVSVDTDMNFEYYLDHVPPMLPADFTIQSVNSNSIDALFEPKTITLTLDSPSAYTNIYQLEPVVPDNYNLTTQKTDVITSPASNATLTIGTSATVNWNTSSLNGETLKMYVLHDDPTGLIFDNTLLSQKNWYMFAENISNNGSYSFNPSILNANGSAYKILMVSNMGDWAVSSGLFSVNSVNTGGGENQTPTISITPYKKGWNLVSSFWNFDPSTIDDDPLLEIMWHYKDSKWYATAPMNASIQSQLDTKVDKLTSLSVGDSFWYKSTDNGSAITATPYSILDISKLNTLSTGWHMLGTGENVTPQNIYTSQINVVSIWTYRDNKWYLWHKDTAIMNTLPTTTIDKLESITAGEGFWINVKVGGN